jgi:hypothetical protein
VERDQPAVGDGDAMRVVSEIGQHRLGTTEGRPGGSGSDLGCDGVDIAPRIDSRRYRINLRSCSGISIPPRTTLTQEVASGVARACSFLIIRFAAPGVAQAQTLDSPELEACKATGLIALKERSPSIKDIILDMDSLTISNANSKVGDMPVRTITMGEAYLERKESGKSQRFLCLIGEKGKVQLTFFTPIVKQPRSEDD